MNKQNVLKNLQDAYNLIQDEKYWTTGVEARNASGKQIYDVNDPTVCQWCLVGAIRKTKVTREDFNATVYHLMKNVQPMLIDGIAFHTIATFNDTKTHAEVLDLLTTTIEALEV